MWQRLTQDLGAALRGELSYWRAYSLFTIQLVIVLVLIWVAIEWLPGSNPEPPLQVVAVLLGLLGPGLWSLWACSTNAPPGFSRLLARGGVVAAVLLLFYLIDLYWT
ncbi:MAG: hypothetical protein AAFX10_00120 [Pseudomonadota bacterium]